jgi:hypothetical protein
MISKKHIVNTTFSSLLVMGLLASQSANATDSKAFPDSMCKPASGEVARFFIGTRNVDPNAAHPVVCPIVRDTMAAPGIASASIIVFDRSPVEDIECTLLSLRLDGSLVASSSRKTYGKGTDYESLQFGKISSATGGHYKIICRIPKGSPAGNGSDGVYEYSSLRSYQIDEND